MNVSWERIILGWKWFYVFNNKIITTSSGFDQDWIIRKIKVAAN